MPRPGRMTTERAKDFKGTLLQLVRTLGRYRLSLVTAIVSVSYTHLTLPTTPYV